MASELELQEREVTVPIAHTGSKNKLCSGDCETPLGGEEPIGL